MKRQLWCALFSFSLASFHRFLDDVHSIASFAFYSILISRFVYFFLLNVFCRLDRDRNFQWCSFSPIHFSLEFVILSIFYSLHLIKLDKTNWMCLFSVFLCNFLWIFVAKKRRPCQQFSVSVCTNMYIEVLKYLVSIFVTRFVCIHHNDMIQQRPQNQYG